MPAPRQSPPVIVKIGGSLAASPDLSAWLAAIDASSLPLVIVPGGGACADAVRSLQQTMRFDDATAHHMALVAMQQYGLALAGLSLRLTLTVTPAAVRRALRLGQVPCWNPVAMVLAAPLPKSWDVTSDSLSAWLAGELGADRLLLIKSIDAPAMAETAADLAAAGIVDPLFSHYAAASGATIHLAGPAALADAAAGFARGTLPGQKIRLG